MRLSAYEEQVLAELEAMWVEDPPAGGRGSGYARLAAPVACLLGGLALLVSAHHAALLIRFSDVWGFTTASITSALSLGGYALMLVGAFLLGRAYRA